MQFSHTTHAKGTTCCHLLLSMKIKGTQTRTKHLTPGFGSIGGVRPANAIHLSSWTGHEVPLDFDDDHHLSGLNKRIREEDKFPEGT
jgi:hypothetical protein